MTINELILLIGAIAGLLAAIAELLRSVRR